MYDVVWGIWSSRGIRVVRIVCIRIMDSLFPSNSPPPLPRVRVCKHISSATTTTTTSINAHTYTASTIIVARVKGKVSVVMRVIRVVRHIRGVEGVRVYVCLCRDMRRKHVGVTRRGSKWKRITRASEDVGVIKVAGIIKAYGASSVIRVATSLG